MSKCKLPCRTLSLYDLCRWEIPYYWAGLKLYDLVAGSRMLHMSRYFSRKESMEAFPTLAQQNALHKTLKGTVVYYDGQMNDSRLNVAIACTAALAGAVVLNHAEAVSLKKDEVTGNVTGIVTPDLVCKHWLGTVG
jgi:glycerol-3-phosphate dehydrogenase